WDRQNIYGGKLRFFWNVGRPLITGGAAYVPLHKVAAMGKGFFAQSEGALLRSGNILTEKDPAKLEWRTLPEGDVGLRTPAGGGRIAEEQSVTALSDGSLFCVYRTIDGHPTHAYSRDGGRTWTAPKYLAYSPGGKLFKHPRAANFVWRCENGKYLYWFHNHGGKVAREDPSWDPYADRNPVWLCSGEERDSPEGKVIHWSQPEVLLYDDDPIIRMSYPDLVEEAGQYYVTETQKNIGRVHLIEPKLLNGLFNQSSNRAQATEGLVLSLPRSGEKLPDRAPLPKLRPFSERDNTRADHGSKDMRSGFSLDLRVQLQRPDAGQKLLDSRDARGKGILLETAGDGALRLTLNDGRQEAVWMSDRRGLTVGSAQHVVATVDGGPKIITFVVDGVLQDGGEERQFGWGRFSPTLRDANGAPTVTIGPAVKRLRIYNRALRTSEAVGNYRAD
ncbi:MAG: LamG-like jellyroll fold domain-containing protein, partial [Actinomycetota bacterium]